MTKQEFLDELNTRLAKLPKEEREERIAFYEEMINDRMEEWPTEEQAVAMVGTVDEVIQQILVDMPLAEIEEHKTKQKRKLKVWELVCLIVGSPIWVSLLIAGCAIVFSLYISVWSVIVAFWAVELSLGVSALATIAAAVLWIIQGHIMPGFVSLGTGFVCIGLTIFMFYACKTMTKGIVFVTKQIISSIKMRCGRKERF